MHGEEQNLDLHPQVLFAFQSSRSISTFLDYIVTYLYSSPSPPDDVHPLSADYGPEEEQLCGEYPDEGLGESDGRSYYTEEQGGLEILQ